MDKYSKRVVIKTGGGALSSVPRHHLSGIRMEYMREDEPEMEQCFEHLVKICPRHCNLLSILDNEKRIHNIVEASNFLLFRLSVFSPHTCAELTRLHSCQIQGDFNVLQS